MALNKVFLIGNVGKDPDIRTTEQGVKVAQFPLATSEAYKDREGNPHQQTEWHNIVAWRHLADVCDNYVKKGTHVHIEGKIKTRSWEDKEGTKRYVTEIVADGLQILTPKGDRDVRQSPLPVPEPARNRGSITQAAARVAAEQRTTPIVPSAEIAEEIEADDLPF